MFVGYTRADWEAVGAKCARICRHVGFGPGDSLLNLLGGGLWVGGPCFDLLADVSGAALVNTGPTGPRQLFEWVPEMGITGLTATPSYLRLLVETAEAEGAALGSWPLRLGFLGGEGASPELRRQVCAAMPEQFVWQETYGSTEVGGAILGYSPPLEPFSGHLNAATDEFVIELLHPDRDEPVQPGDVGEVTVTTFREASPLVRYRTRDLAAAVDAPRDASGLPRMTAVVGRIDDALKVRGALVYPSSIEEVLVARLAAGAEWRIVLRRDRAALDVLTVSVEAADDRSAERLASDLHQRLLVRPVVEVVPVGTFERFPGKARRVLDERPED
ncbi:MAG: AMP-binding protein [Acidimicrobiia bacterium]|nr:AMP-binding protein [Acidimicrobiia bacterium]